MPEPGETTLSSVWFYGAIYSVLAVLIYSHSKIMYDFELDRYYHIRFPAIMEYCDVLTRHYHQKLQSLKHKIPRSLADLLPKSEETPAIVRTLEIPQEHREAMLRQEQNLGTTLMNIFSAQRTIHNALEEKEASQLENKKKMMGQAHKSVAEIAEPK